MRTARKKRYAATTPLALFEKGLARPPFFRCHKSFIVNLDRVRLLRRRGEADYELKGRPRREQPTR